MTITTLAALLAVLAADMALVALFARGLIQPVRAIRTALDDTARGNGTAGVANPYAGDLGEMIDEMNGALRSIGDTLSSLLYEGVHVATAHLDMIIATESRLTEGNDAYESGEHPQGPAPRQTERLMRGLERAGQVTTAMLRELERYEIPHKPLLLAQADHVHWLQQLVQMLAGHSDLKPDEVPPHDRCRFDRWYLREGAGHQSHRDEYYALAGPHERFHEQARLVVECHRAGKADQAKRAFAELVAVTRELLGRLDELYQAMSTANRPSLARKA